MVSGEAAIEIAMHAGLRQQDALTIFNLTRSINGMYKLPWGAVNEPFAKERDVGKGLSTSVLMAELHLSLVIWKISLCSLAVTVTYVDDVTVTASNANDLDLPLFPFSSTLRRTSFLLCREREKAYLWESDHAGLEVLSEKWGMPIKQSLSALGAEWGLRPSFPPTYNKDCARKEEALQRLTRLKHLAAPIPSKHMQL